MTAPATAERLLESACAFYAARPALALASGNHLSFAEVAASIAATREALRQRGIDRDDRVGLFAPISPTVALASLGVIASAVAVHLPPDMPPRELEPLADRLGLRAIAAPANLAIPARDAAARAGIPWLEFRLDGPSRSLVVDGPGAGAAVSGRPAMPEDFANIALSSGVTGRPKLIPRTHRNVAAMAARVSSVLPLPPGNRTTVLMPYFHFGWVQVIRSIETGGAASLDGEFDRGAMPVWLARHRPTWLVLNPSMLDGLVDTLDLALPPAGGALEFVQVSAITLPPALRARAAAALGVPILDCYGSNEAGTVAMETPRNPAPAGSAGRSTVPVRITGDDGLPLPSGQTGFIEIPAAEAFPGYFDDSAATARAFTADGWYRMGDRGSLTGGDFLLLAGRADDVINRGGEKIDPSEVEAVLLAHPDVVECAVFPVPHPAAGQEPAAAVVLRPGARAGVRDLRRWTLDRLAAAKVPRRIVIVSALPRTATGKIRRTDLPGLIGSRASLVPPPARPSAPDGI